VLEVKPQPKQPEQPERPEKSEKYRKAGENEKHGRPDPARSLPPEGLSIAEAAHHSGVSAHTLRYYERAGLVVSPVDRTAGGRRRYHRVDLQWIKVCTRLRATGMPIKSIRHYAELVAAGPGNEHERLALLEAHRAEVMARLAETRQNLELIDHKIDVYRGRLAAGDADRLWAPASRTDHTDER
jgi:DNA-binding transcriptional MerR regulator